MSDLFEPAAVGVRTRTARPSSTAATVLGLLALLGIVALLIVLAARQPTTGYLHPDSPEEGGGRALATLLSERGVDVVVATRLADVRAQAADGVTTFVADISTLSPGQQEALAGLAGDVVLVGDPVHPFGALTDAVTTVAAGSPDPVAADCADPDAAAAARISATRGSLRPAREGVTMCFPVADGGAYATWAQGAGTWRAIADSALLTNAALASDGNAALAMRALGHNATLVWYLPSYEDPAQQTVFSPPYYRALMWFAVLLALTACAVLGPRFGPLGREDLPVVVRGGEIVRGLGRLYARGRQSGHAAEHLRAATRARLCAHLGVDERETPDAITAAIARASGRSAADVRRLLFGPPPASGAHLTELAGRLTDLEREVHL